MRNAVWLLLAVSGCSKWVYYPVYDAVSAQEQGVTLTFEREGISLGTLTVENTSDKPAQVLWDGVSVIDSEGRQNKVYKGDVRVMDKERSVPNQPVDPGARIEETVVFEAAESVMRSRPATAWDYGLCWAYGLGCLIGNGWKPTPEYAGSMIPDWENLTYTLVVPVRVADQDVHVRVEMKPSEVGFKKFVPVE